VARCQHNLNSGILETGKTQDKQNHHCTMAGIELGKFASGHEMSKQQSEKQNFHNTNWIALGKLGDTYNFATSPFLHCMIFTGFLCQSCESYAAAFAVEM